MDRIADNIPEFADRVSDIRARAAEALTPEADGDEERIDDAWGEKADRRVECDPETGEVLDTVAQKVAERRGAAPRDTPPQDESLPG